MRPVVQIIRVFVGVLFIISGAVKANDPLGLSYKMQEFFEIWNTDLGASHFILKSPLITLFSFLHEQSLFLSVLMIGLEIMAGLALLIGWKPKSVVNLLLLLIVFFTFLTGYAFASGKFKNCGCFGDCLPITPLTSFLKDLLLLLLILFLVIYRRYITPVFPAPARNTLLITGLIVTILFQWYVLNFLPVVDCLPFKRGNNISEQMKIPPGALPDSFAIRFVYEKSGKKYEFSPTGLPADLGSYKFVDRTDKLIRKGNAEPPIKGFSLIGVTDTDSTGIVLALPKVVLLFCENFDKDVDGWIDHFKKLNAAAQSKGIPVYVVATSIQQASEVFGKNGLGSIPVFGCDYTAVRTAARTNPCVYLLRSGTVYDKQGFRKLDKVAKEVASF